MKAIIYCRVSTSLQDNERQLIQLRNKCKERNFEIVSEYTETMSGMFEIRDELTKMLKEIKAGGIDYVVISELSRLGRTEETIKTIKQIHDCKTNFISIKENIETNVSNDAGLQTANLVVGLISSISSYEISTFKYRSREGVYKSVLNGGVLGSINYPYGYKNENKKLVINEEEAEYIKEIFSLYLKGYGTTKIANILNDKSIPTRSKKIIEDGLNKKEYKYKMKWVDGTIYSILKNPIYKGFRRFKGEEIEQSNLMIIEPDVFDNIQSMLKSNYNKGKVKNPNFNYILSRHKLFCGICGRSYYPHKRESGKDNRYVCLSKRDKKNECNNVGISITKVEKLIHEIIFYMLKDMLIMNLDNDKIIADINSKKEELLFVENEFTKFSKVESDLLDSFLLKNFSEKIVAEKLEYLKKKRRIAKIDLITIKMEISELERVKKNMEDVEEIKRDYIDKKEKLPKEIVDKLIKKIIITKQDNFPTDFNKVKSDNIVQIEVNTIDSQQLKFLISQRTDLEFYYNPLINMWTPLHAFFSKTTS